MIPNNHNNELKFIEDELIPPFFRIFIELPVELLLRLLLTLYCLSKLEVLAEVGGFLNLFIFCSIETEELVLSRGFTK